VADVSDATPREIAVLVPLATFSLLMGVWWYWTLQHFDPYAKELARVLGG